MTRSHTVGRSNEIWLTLLRGSGSEQQAALHDLREALLRVRQRTALLAELRGMPQVEIARHLGSNRNAVYKLIHDARKRLKRGLEAAGYHAADVHAAFS